MLFRGTGVTAVAALRAYPLSQVRVVLLASVGGGALNAYVHAGVSTSHARGYVTSGSGTCCCSARAVAPPIALRNRSCGAAGSRMTKVYRHGKTLSLGARAQEARRFRCGPCLESILLPRGVSGNSFPTYRSSDPSNNPRGRSEMHIANFEFARNDSNEARPAPRRRWMRSRQNGTPGACAPARTPRTAPPTSSTGASRGGGCAARLCARAT